MFLFYKTLYVSQDEIIKLVSSFDEIDNIHIKIKYVETKENSILLYKNFNTKKEIDIVKLENERQEIDIYNLEETKFDFTNKFDEITMSNLNQKYKYCGTEKLNGVDVYKISFTSKIQDVYSVYWIDQKTGYVLKKITVTKDNDIETCTELEFNYYINEVIDSDIEEPKIEKLSFSVPISGEVQKVFSNDKVIYSKTLDMWKTHDGIDIKANIGDKVKSIEKGTVTKIFEDSFYGITIVIDHGQGYVSYYANLSPDVSVKEKQSIVKGKVIGTISNTAIGEIKDEAHLHFCLMKDNNVVDPTYIFN